jgi:hypothetical protein
MTTAIVELSLLCFGSVLALGLFGVLHDLLGDSAQDGPIFREPGPAFQCFEARSQFAWQSRSHFREPD